MDFAGSHFYESVPIALIQNPRHEEACRKLFAALGTFRRCNYSNSTTALMMESVCDTCADELVRVCKGDNLVLGSTTIVMLALCQAQCKCDNTPLRSVAYLIENLLRQSAEIRHKFLQCFEARQHQSARDYNEEY